MVEGPQSISWVHTHDRVTLQAFRGWQHLDGPVAMAPAGEQTGDVSASGLVAVHEHHAQPRSDPVRDDEEEALVVGARVPSPASPSSRPATPKTTATMPRARRVGSEKPRDRNDIAPE